MYCIKCGAHLSEGQSICPICETKVYHPDFPVAEEKSTYPKKDFKSEEFNKKGLMLVITILFLIPVVLPLILDYNWHREISWSGYVSLGVIAFYVIFILPGWFKRPHPAIFFPTSFLAVTLFVFYVNYKTDGDWFYRFAMPVCLVFGAIISAVAILLHCLKRGKLYIYGGSFIALGVWTVMIEMLTRVVFGVNNSFYWSTCTMAICFIVGMLLIIIEIIKPVKESLRKFFYIG